MKPRHTISIQVLPWLWIWSWQLQQWLKHSHHGSSREHGSRGRHHGSSREHSSRGHLLLSARYVPGTAAVLTHSKQDRLCFDLQIKINPSQYPCSI